MRILAVSSAWGRLPEAAGRYDAVVALGRMGHTLEEAAAVLRALASLGPVYFVVAADDPPGLERLEEPHVTPLCGAGRIGPLEAWGLCAGRAERPGGPVHLLLAHVPPLGYVDGWGIGRLGSREVREAVEALSPRLSLHGTVRGEWGIDMLGHTVVVNPGSLRQGRYAVVEWGSSISARISPPVGLGLPGGDDP